MEIKCGICGHRGDADEFTPKQAGPDDPDWECPNCGCGVITPATLTDDFFQAVQDAAP